MAKEKDVLGYIDCPSCGTSDGMRITHDKNAEPFGFCEAECNQQLRIGGSPRRVALFVKRYPWAAGVPVPVPVPEKKPEKVATEAKPAPGLPVSVPVPKKPVRSGFDMGL